MSIAIQISGVKLGFIEATDVQVQLVHPGLAEEMDSVCERIRRTHTIEQVALLDSVRAVRAMFRAWGVDPSRYRPSSEALLRRVVQGKGLYRISNVVDVCNLCSIETGWPFGLYDRAHLAPPMVMRLGENGESYEGIGKQTWHLAGRPILVDARGPFGCPISDSTRTMITESTRALVSVIFAPASVSEEELQIALEHYAQRLESYAAARTARLMVIFS
ncbi:MAG: phenylalanine--tRNA ligase beta subunit-related protein [Acidobacteria bacterium]|nr:phenylalanine--tRNA ligase beta subunit-related protein [Acidobacteriota bacterium]